VDCPEKTGSCQHRTGISSNFSKENILQSATQPISRDCHHAIANPVAGAQHFQDAAEAIVAANNMYLQIR
jgi:hypothetical protein